MRYDGLLAVVDPARTQDLFSVRANNFALCRAKVLNFHLPPPCFLQFSAHDRGERVLDRPHAERHRAHGLRPAADLIFMQVDAALDALCRKKNARAVRYQCTYRLLHVRRDAAAAERLDNDARKAVQDREERQRKVGREREPGLPGL